MYSSRYDFSSFSANFQNHKTSNEISSRIDLIPSPISSLLLFPVAPQERFLLLYSVLRFNRHDIHLSSLYSRRPGLQGRQEKKKLKKKKHEVLPYNVKREPLYSICSISTHPHRIGDFNNELVMCGSIFARWPPLSSSETNAAMTQVMEQPPLQH